MPAGDTLTMGKEETRGNMCVTLAPSQQKYTISTCSVSLDGTYYSIFYKPSQTMQSYQLMRIPACSIG